MGQRGAEATHVLLLGLLLLGLLLFRLLLLGLLLLLLLVLLGLVLLLGPALLLLQRRKGLSVKLRRLLGQLDLAQHGLELRLVDQRGEPAVDVGEGAAECGVQDLLEELEQRGREGNVGQRHALAHKEGAALKDAVEDLKDALDVLLRLGGGALVVLDDAERRVHPCARRGVDLLVRQADILLDKGSLVCVVGGKRVAGAGNVLRDGASLVDGLAVGCHERRDLAERELCEKLGGLGGDAELERGLLVDDLDGKAGVLRGDQNAVQARVARERVDFLRAWSVTSEQIAGSAAAADAPPWLRGTKRHVPRVLPWNFYGAGPKFR